MEDHQELEKPIFELLHHWKLRSSRKKKISTMYHHYEEIFCYYGLRESPKKRTTQKPLRIKKRLVLCGECGKGFRYDKCLRNHSETMHSLKEKNKKKKSDSTRRDLLCFFRSGGGVQRRKRSKRVSRYKKSLPPPLSVSSSYSSTFANDGELLEVAESLIMLSKSGHALFSNLEMNQRECGDEQKLVGRFRDGSLSKCVGMSTEYDGTSKELLGFLGDKKVMKEDESGQLKQVGTESLGEEVRLERVSLEDSPGDMLKKAETDIEKRLGGQESVFEVSNSASKGFQMNNEHRCRLCDRVFSTYQALGGHQTFHRMKNNFEKPRHKMQTRVGGRS